MGGYIYDYGLIIYALANSLIREVHMDVSNAIRDGVVVTVG